MFDRSTASRLGIAAVALSALTMFMPSAVAQTTPQKLVADAQTTLSDFMRDPDQTWIHDNIGRAKALLIVPQIVKAGFIFGGSGGQGVLVVRNGKSWSGPAFYDLATASVGFQAGVEVSELVMVVMTEKGLNSLLSSSFKIGGDASVAAGPVGAGAKSTVTADLISFSRAKGVYGGVNLDGTVVYSNVRWNDAYYGKSGVLPPDILIRRTATSPKSAALLGDVGKATR